jgi:hypothetical protein
MSQIQKGIFGALAIGLTLGAVQLAFAHDLIGGRQAVAASTAPETGVNRAAKADRATVPASSTQTQTIARQSEVADTSVLIRVPVPTRPVPPSMKKPRGTKTAIACEPPVSVLTEVAKLLQPGRCVT